MKPFLRKIFTKIFTHQAARIIKKYNLKVVVIVGSVGKTGTRQAISSLLGSQYRIKYQKDNYNIPLSVPFVITGQTIPSPIYNGIGWIKAWWVGQRILKSGYDYDCLVLEYGIDYIGEMQLFAPICQPDYVVVTAVSAEHMEFFKTIDQVAKEELSVSKFAKNLLINDQTVERQYIEAYLEKDALVQYYGSQPDLDYQETVKRLKSGFYHLEVTDKEGRVLVSSETKLIARHGLNALTAAVAIASKFGVSRQVMESIIKDYIGPKGRMRLYTGINNSLIIDDTYNSSPLAALAALETLSQFETKKRIALLGNMNELGELAPEAHEQVGQACRPDYLDLVVTLGPEANRYLGPVAEKQGCRVISVETPYQAAEVLRREMIAGTVLLAKGSQNRVYAEEAIKPLLASERDQAELVRQGPEWLTKKKNSFSNLG